MRRELQGYREYVEAWKLAHETMLRRWAIEDVIRKANHVFDGIVHLRADLNSNALGEQAGELCVRRVHLLRQWLDSSELVVSEAVPQLEKEHGEVEGARSSRAKIEKARVEIYSTERIEIDADGNVYEQSGERANVPGVDPERLARSISDASARRTRSLKDIIAAGGAH